MTEREFSLERLGIDEPPSWEEICVSLADQVTDLARRNAELHATIIRMAYCRIWWHPTRAPSAEH